MDYSRISYQHEFLRISYQHEFLAELAEILRERPEDGFDRLDQLTAINDGWLQGPEEKQANCSMIEAVYEALQELG